MSRSSTTTASRAGRIRTHPGEVLREEFMQPLGLSANALALALRVPATRIGAIVRSERPRAVTLEPSADPVNWTWADGTLAIIVPSVRIHDIVVIS